MPQIPSSTPNFASRLHGVSLLAWSHELPTRLDNARRFIDVLLHDFFTFGDALHGDRALSDHGKREKFETYRRERIRPHFDDLRKLAQSQREILKHLQGTLDAISPHDWVGELHRREIRDHLVSLPADKRSEQIELAIMAKDEQTLRAIVQAPFVRSEIGSQFTRDRAREALWRLTNPTDAEDFDVHSRAVSHFEATLVQAEREINRTVIVPSQTYATQRAGHRALEEARRVAGSMVVTFSDTGSKPEDAWVSTATAADMEAGEEPALTAHEGHEELIESGEPTGGIGS